MDREPRPRTPFCPEHRDIDGGAGRISQIPKSGGIAMAQQGSFTAGKYGSHPVALATDLTHRVYPAVNATKPPVRNASLDCRGSNPKAMSCHRATTPCWRPASRAMMVSSTLIDLPAPGHAGGVSEFWSEYGPKSRSPPHGGREMRPRGAGSETKRSRGCNGRPTCPDTWEGTGGWGRDGAARGSAGGWGGELGGWAGKRPACGRRPGTRRGHGLLQEALVVAHHELRLDLLHGVEGHADDDQDRGAAEVEVRRCLVDQDRR